MKTRHRKLTLSIDVLFLKPMVQRCVYYFEYFCMSEIVHLKNRKH